MAGFNAFLKNNNIITGTAIPTEGNFKTGDIIVNVGPNSAIEPMWICNEGGNPGIWGPVGVGSGSIVSINSSVLISEPTNEISLASLGVGVSSKDKLLVHYNSTHLLEGVHFEISNDGSKIVKLGEGYWNPDGLENCIFALELFKGVESIDGDKIVVDSKMTSITNHVVIENACSEVEIGIEGFNAGNDMMLVFKNGVNMVEGVDYEVQGSTIVSTGEVWNENGLEDYGMTFVVFKEVVEYDGSAEVKAENIADGSIGMNKLGEDVREAIEDASNIDLSGYATKEEMNGKVAQGEYDSKIAELEGRVEEAFTSANNGKQLIANAIGDSSITADSTFSAMGDAIIDILQRNNNEDYIKLINEVSNLDENMITLLKDASNSSPTISTNNVSYTNMTENRSYSYFLADDGTVWVCGSNTYGGLGLGENGNINIITQVPDMDNVKQIVCSLNYTIILKNDGTVWACGRNYYGQLGLGDTTDRNTFTQVTTNVNNDVKQIACGTDHTFILKNDGSIWACGNNGYGQLGIDGNTKRTTFTQVTTNINNDVKQIACGTSRTFIIKNDGSLWTCGRNNYGQLGFNDTTDRNTFTQVTTNVNNDVKQIACGDNYTIILKIDGSIWGTGYNGRGNLGLGDTATYKTFTQVTTNINNDVKQVDCGQYFTFILKNDGSIWACGINARGQLGLGDITNRNTFTKVTTNVNNDVKYITCNASSIFIIKNDDSTWGTGYNGVGNLGIGHMVNPTTFTLIDRTQIFINYIKQSLFDKVNSRGISYSTDNSYTELVDLLTNQKIDLVDTSNTGNVSINFFSGSVYASKNQEAPVMHTYDGTISFNTSKLNLISASLSYSRALNSSATFSAQIIIYHMRNGSVLSTLLNTTGTCNDLKNWSTNLSNLANGDVIRMTVQAVGTGAFAYQDIFSLSLNSKLVL